MRVRHQLRHLLLVVLLAFPAAAEKAAVNIHLDPMLGTGLDQIALVTGANLKIDTTLLSFLGPVAPQIEFLGISGVNNRYLDQGVAYAIGIGARLRLFNDELGYLWYPGHAYRGNAWGNLFIDAHLIYVTEGYGLGFDAGLGYEFSLIDGLSVGPVAKFALLGPHQTLTFGLSFTIGAPQVTPPESDFDNDGIKGDDDKCVDKAGPTENNGCPDTDEDNDSIVDRLDKCMKEAEDKDSFEDTDGCPDKDNDGDSFEDANDACPNEKGIEANKGCPDKDTDGDGLIDRLDKCPKDVGNKDNNGCADSDKDGDSVVDRLDACVDVKGDPANKGCAWPDADNDTVADRFDNCPGEAGTAANQGCAEKMKQLVQITPEKLVVKDAKDKIKFDAKATLLSKGALDQVALVLKAHPEIMRVQVEGHTEAGGNVDANKTLSGDRAKAVVEYLVKKGVEASRLVPVAVGGERPVDSGTTPAAAEANRRIELVITWAP